MVCLAVITNYSVRTIFQPVPLLSFGLFFLICCWEDHSNKILTETKSTFFFCFLKSIAIVWLRDVISNLPDFFLMCPVDWTRCFSWGLWVQESWRAQSLWVCSWCSVPGAYERSWWMCRWLQGRQPTGMRESMFVWELKSTENSERIKIGKINSSGNSNL